jgi:pyruvate kinase
MNKTKIIATIGPVSSDKNTIKKMIKSGMNAARINLSHGDIDQYKKIISNIRHVKDIPIIFDTQGPEIRIICKEKKIVKKNEVFKIGFDDSHTLYFNKDFYNQLRCNNLILVNEGILKLKIVSKNSHHIQVRALVPGSIGARARVNIPSITLNSNILTNKDIECLNFAQKNNVDFVALSYTRNAKDILFVKEKFPKLKVIAKIENSTGVKNFDKILNVTDGVMVARGDLGVEIPSERLPLVQKAIIYKCNLAGKFVITATQMLQSMIENAKPTRAETSDVANAILDGTDMVMLSGETAIGKHAVLAVLEMSYIAKEIEPYTKNKVKIDSCKTISQAVSKSIHELTRILPITKIVTLTRAGYTSRLISRFRLKAEIIAVTQSLDVQKELMMHYGVNPTILKLPKTNKIVSCAKQLYKKGLLKKNDLVLFTAGVYAKKSGNTNMLEIHRISELSRQF